MGGNSAAAIPARTPHKHPTAKTSFLQSELIKQQNRQRGTLGAKNSYFTTISDTP